MTKKDDNKEFEITLPPEIEKQIPFVFRGLVKDFIKFLNKLDLNKDGKGDIKQLAPLVIAALPSITALASHIDWTKVLEWGVQNFAKDKGAARVALAEAKGHVEIVGSEADKLIASAKDVNAPHV